MTCLYFHMRGSTILGMLSLTFDTQVMHSDARPILCIHKPGNDKCPKVNSPVFAVVGDGDFRGGGMTDDRP